MSQISKRTTSAFFVIVTIFFLGLKRSVPGNLFHGSKFLILVCHTATFKRGATVALILQVLKRIGFEKQHSNS